jgi:hypothetical protein
MIDGPAPAGYQEAISPRSRSDDIAARAKLDIEIRRARIKLERLELAERTRRISSVLPSSTPKRKRRRTGSEARTMWRDLTREEQEAR